MKFANCNDVPEEVVAPEFFYSPKFFCFSRIQLEFTPKYRALSKIAY
ncbi:hypothetical protein LEP1GSC048_0890 [Leptospira santarosai serovar Shermani str. 1342KT]|nr:hypothetical protein LEP1GSC048_0890 [Leptospira santarosai serovar Shermani str. 1342KT]